MHSRYVSPACRDQQFFKLEVIARPLRARFVPVGNHLRNRFGKHSTKRFWYDRLLHHHHRRRFVKLSQVVKLVASFLRGAASAKKSGHQH